jgi:hypothetical protein
MLPGGGIYIYVDKQKLYTTNYAVNTDDVWNNRCAVLVVEVFLTTTFNRIFIFCLFKKYNIMF